MASKIQLAGEKRDNVFTIAGMVVVVVARGKR
jgi:hypothetical protein